MRLLGRTIVATALCLRMSSTSRADTLIYDFVASNTPYGIISTSLPASPTPVSSTASSFELGPVPIVVDGDALPIVVDFYTGAAGGDASGLYDGDVYRYDGPQLFSGSKGSPTSLTGIFSFDDFLLLIREQGRSTPSAGQSDIPEPSTLVLFGIGLLVGGGLLRLRLASRQHRRS